MANSVTIPSAGAADTITLARVLRNAFLADFTRNNRGAHARLEVLGPDVGYQVETDNRPFDGIAADENDGEDAVWITLDLRPSSISRMAFTASQPFECAWPPLFAERRYWWRVTEPRRCWS